MGDKKEESNIFEFADLLTQYSKESIEDLEVLNTESVREFLKSNKVKGIAPQLNLSNLFINRILLGSIDAQSYDDVQFCSYGV